VQVNISRPHRRHDSSDAAPDKLPGALVVFVTDSSPPTLTRRGQCSGYRLWRNARFFHCLDHAAGIEIEPRLADLEGVSSGERGNIVG